VKGLAGVRAISASWTHSLALMADGTVRAWGANKFGEIGTSTVSQCGSATNSEACALSPVTVPLPPATGVSAGFSFSLAIVGGQVYSWGHNEYGQLGSGGEEEYRMQPGLVSGLSGVTAISAGNTHAAALTGGAIPRPTMEAVPGPRSLTINWEAVPSSAPWYLAYRPIEEPAAAWQSVKLAPPTRTFTATGLEPRRYEVVIRQIPEGTFARGTVEATPGP
jgi:hypothetical protein